ncbi:3-hydroxylacyl-ACP dehydratase [Bacteroides sp. BFG-551]|nr:3-hydroxylacyl-ACP dehydratase [Bacteroides sp. BFG-551]
MNPGHPVYQGHFPEHPVVPGVCLLQLIKECVEDIRQQKLQIAQVSSCKFLSAINPIETPYISVALTFKETEEGTLQLQAEGSVKEGAVKKNIVKESSIKDSSIEENCAEGHTVKSEYFIKLKAALTPKA